MNPFHATRRKHPLLLSIVVLGLLSTSLPSKGAPFPTGLSILYSRVGTPNGTIGLVNADTGVDSTILSGEKPALGPDGHSLLVYRDNPTFSLANVYLHDLAGGSDRLLLSDNGNYIVGVDWLLDGNRVVFDFSCDIEVVNADGTGRGGFIGGDCYDDSPSVHPQDGRIVFHNAHAGLLLADASGANRRFLTGTQPGDYWPVWSPVDGRIAFWNGDNLMMISEGGPRVNVSAGAGGGTKYLDGRPAWTPDGVWLIAGTSVNGTNGLWAFATDGTSRLLRLPTAPGADIHWVGNVIPTTQTAGWVTASLAASVIPLIVTSGAETTAVIKASNIGPGTLVGGRVTNELPAGVELISSSVSQGTVHTAGSTVVAAFGDIAAQASATCTLRLKSTIPGRHAISLTFVGSAAGVERTFATSQVAFVVSSLPQKYAGGIFYSRRDAGGDGIWFLPGNGSDETKITDGGRPRLSPDGTALAFERGDVAGSRGNVWVRDLITGDEKLIFSHSDYVVGSTWSADSARVIFDYSCQIYARTRTGEDAGVVIPGGDCYNDAPQVNIADGRIAYLNIHNGLLVADANGQNSRLVPNALPGNYWPVWSPDSTWLAHINGKDVWKIRTDGTGRTALTQTSLPADSFINTPAWTPSGSHIIAGGSYAGKVGLFTISADQPVSVSLLKELPPESTIIDVGAVLGEVGLGLQIERLLNADGSIKELAVLGPSQSDYVIESSTDLLKWSPFRTNGPVFLGRFVIPFRDVPIRFFRAAGK